GEVVEVGSLEAWTTYMAEANSNKNLAVIYFSAKWSAPSRSISPVFDDLAKNHIDVTFLKVVVEVEDNMSIAEEFGVEAMPTFLFMKEGKVVDHLVGASEYLLEEKMKQHTAA
ncbi:hypothetical protein CFC21_106319, partial [Triticum aestivum]